MSPEVQLLYKAKPHTLTKDQSDFDVAKPCMTEKALSWLFNRLKKRFPEGHLWITSLKEELAKHAGRGGADYINPNEPTEKTS